MVVEDLIPQQVNEEPLEKLDVKDDLEERWLK